MSPEIRAPETTGKHRDSSTSSQMETSSVQDGDDEWFGAWDGKIHRCSFCDRPFLDPAKLETHVRAHADALETEAAPTPPITPEIIDTDTYETLEEIILGRGDLMLETTNKDGDKVGYLVGSQVLCTASAVFRELLGPGSPFDAGSLPWAVVRGRRVAVMQVEDDLESLGLVLKVLHHRHDLPRGDIEYAQFVKIAEVCLTYGLCGPLQALADGLVESLGLIEKAASIGYCAGSVLIAYVFGDENLFAVATERVIRYSCLWEGGLLCPGSERLSANLPSSITSKLSSVGTPTDSASTDASTETLTRERADRVNGLQSLLKELQTELSDPDSDPQAVPPHEHCKALMLGSLILAVAEFNLNSKDTWNKPLSNIVTELRKIKPVFLADHEKCDWVKPFVTFATKTWSEVEGLQLANCFSTDCEDSASNGAQERGRPKERRLS